MFELKRSELLKEEVKINGEIITTELNLSKNSKNILKDIKDLQVIQVNLQQEKDLYENLQRLGEITIKIIKMFFGNNANKVLEFYSVKESFDKNERVISTENTEEMLIEVMPFLVSLLPKIHDFMSKKQQQFAESIKGKSVR